MAAQLAVSRGLAERVAGTGVTVNAVLPGPTRSEGVGTFFAKLAKEKGVTQEEIESQFIAENRPSSLLRRLATVEEIANMVVYVCSPQASATTALHCVSTVESCARSRDGAVERCARDPLRMLAGMISGAA